jgi:hypothetical protein
VICTIILTFTFTQQNVEAPSHVLILATTNVIHTDRNATAFYTSIITYAVWMQRPAYGKVGSSVICI